MPSPDSLFTDRSRIEIGLGGANGSALAYLSTWALENRASVVAMFHPHCPYILTCNPYLDLAVAPRIPLNSLYSSSWDLSAGDPIFHEIQPLGHAGETRSQEIKKRLWYMPSSKSQGGLSPTPLHRTFY